MPGNAPGLAGRVARPADATAVTDPGGGRVVRSVTGELFFASANDPATRFDYAADPGRIVIGLRAAPIRDSSSVAAPDTVTTTYAQRGKTLETSAQVHRQ